MKIAVTGAFGYSGRYITRRLLEAGHDVITLTNSLQRRNSFGGAVEAFPFDFDQPDRLRETLKGVEALVNTYWVRFDHRCFTHREAVANTRILFGAARRAGVRRIVHVSITNPDIHSPLPYFRGKAELEVALQELGVSYCILRPTVLFGKEDILINNIAWALRHLPIFGLFGAGDYKLQPIYVDDLAAAAVDRITRERAEVVHAIGPETFTFRELAEAVKTALRLRRMIMPVPPGVGYWACRVLGLFLRDVIITREEIQGLMAGRLCVDAAPLGVTKLSDWLAENREVLGRRYASELARRIDRRPQGGVG